MTVALLGAGRVGRAIALDLAQSDIDVRALDISSERLQELAEAPHVETVEADLSDSTGIAGLTENCDVAVSAVPGSMGYETVRALLQAGRDVVDISFFPEDAMTLSGEAESNGCRCLVDFGIAPGCSNLILGMLLEAYGNLERFACYVGGLPTARVLPWQYSAPFSPADVIEEYTRPARIVENGAVVTVPALSAPELIDFPGLGTLEGFVTDGLRTTLRYADRVPSMIEKTLRYPGHRELVEVLLGSGFLSDRPVELGGVNVAPRDLTSKLLIDAWHMDPDEPDLTVMLVEAMGSNEESGLWEASWIMSDFFDQESGISSMARTTGYTCTAGVHLLLNDVWSEIGLFPPEDVGMHDESFEFVMSHLESRGIVFQPVE